MRVGIYIVCLARLGICMEDEIDAGIFLIKMLAKHICMEDTLGQNTFPARAMQRDTRAPL